MKVKKLIKQLEEWYKPNDTILAHLWIPEDVIMRGKEQGRKVTQEQAEQVIESMEHHLDCCYGITWDTIDAELDAMGIEASDDYAEEG